MKRGMMVTVRGCVQEPNARQFCARDQDSTQYTTSTGWGAGSTRPARGGFPGAFPTGSRMDAGICGDPFSPRPGQRDTVSSFNAKPCEPQATYSQGQTITVRLTMPAYHGGFIQIRICPEQNTNPSQACFDANILKLCAAESPSHVHCLLGIASALVGVAAHINVASKMPPGHVLQSMVECLLHVVPCPLRHSISAGGWGKVLPT